jgi:hypothetical protein
MAAGCRARLFNLYGTTEGSVWASAYELPLVPEAGTAARPPPQADDEDERGERELGRPITNKAGRHPHDGTGVPRQVASRDTAHSGGAGGRSRRAAATGEGAGADWPLWDAAWWGRIPLGTPLEGTTWHVRGPDGQVRTHTHT